MTERPRKPILPNIVLACVLVACLLVPVYVLSYAPVFRGKNGADHPSLRRKRLHPNVILVGSVIRRRPEAELSGYHPVELLIDRTTLAKPLVAWGDLWGCGETMRECSRLRIGAGWP